MRIIDILTIALCSPRLPTRIRREFITIKQAIRAKYEKIKPALAVLSSHADRLLEKPMAPVLVLAVVLNLLIEMFSRHSPIQGFAYIIQHPYLFFYNASIILLTLFAALLFPRRSFSVGFISLCWLALGVINCVVLSFRITPLGAVDFMVAGSVFSMFSIYLSLWQVVLIAAIAVLLLIALALLFLRSKKRKVRWKIFLPALAIVALLVEVWTTHGISSGALATNFGNLGTAYNNYGFVYCFVNSAINTGIHQPDNYSPEQVDAILQSIGGEDGEESGNNPVSNETPNIVMVQLESFFDPYYFSNYTFSEDPIPNFRALKESCPHGFLSVPAVGAGTANTEFEMLSGLSLDFFGPGEYPYKTILKKATCETICYNLDALGYTSRAIHNHTGSFYSRDEVYAHLGFDSFTSKEFMPHLTTNPLDWADDSVLTEEILKALRTDTGPSFVFTVSVQPHGRYPETVIDPDQTITMSGEENEMVKNGLEYYINQLYECDQFVGELIAALSDYDEPVVLVLYGDHLPNIDWTEDMLSGCDLYQTEYVIWSNYGLQAEGGDLEAYQLSAHLLEQLDIHEGVITRLHQNNSGDADYQEQLKTLGYDMLYGDQNLYDGENPYEVTDMIMGTIPVRVHSVRQLGTSLYVSGEQFTKWSGVIINDESYDTELLSENALLVRDYILQDGDEICVQQDTYSRSNTVTYQIREASD